MATISTILSLVAIIGMIVSTCWGMVRPSYDRSLPLEFLARQARPLKKGLRIAYFISALFIAVALILAAFDHSETGRSMLSVASPAAVLGGLLITRLFQRVYALEEIIKRSRPDVYSGIRDEKAGPTPAPLPDRD